MRPSVVVMTEFVSMPIFAELDELACTIVAGDILLIVNSMEDGCVSFFSTKNTSFHTMPISALRNFVDEKELMLAMLRL